MSVKPPSGDSSIEMEPLSDTITNPTIKAITSAPGRKSHSYKVVKRVALLAIPVIAGAVSLATRLEMCKSMSSEECAEEHAYLHPVEMVGGVYTAGALVVGFSKCICKNMFS